MEEGGSHGRDQAAAKPKPKKKSEAEVRVELVQAQRHHRELGKAPAVERRSEASKQLGRCDLGRSANLVLVRLLGTARSDAALGPQRC